MNTTSAQINKRINTTALTALFLVAVFASVFGVAALSMPSKAHADFNPFNPLDPFCLFSCGSTKTVTKIVPVGTTTNNYIGSNVNSPGGTVVNGNPSGTQTPVYVYNDNNYNSPLNASCYSSPNYVNTGESMTWRVSAYGGNGNYYYSWSGTDGLSGNGSAISKTYYSPGTKNASVTITSGNQTISRNCEPSLRVYEYNYNNNNYNYYDNYNYNNYNSYSPLYVSCSVNTSFAPVGQNVLWSSSVSGGNGYYTYRWSGTDNLYGYNSSINTSYSGSGQKYATLTVTSDGQSVARQCNSSVTIGVPNQYYVNNYNTNYNQTGNLEIACFADRETARTGVPVTWAVEVTGGDWFNYNFSWSGSDGLSGSQRSAVISYGTTGTKNATVSVTSGGYTASKLCGNAVTVNSGQVAGASTQAKATKVKTTTDDSLSASSLFSLSNVPWGWVAVLVILVLFMMVVYLLFNRKEI